MSLSSSFHCLPNIAEDLIKQYLAANLATAYQKKVPDNVSTIAAAYQFARSFSNATLAYPAVIVAVGKLKEMEPEAHVYEGELSIEVGTQMDDTGDDALTVHDGIFAALYELLADKEALKTALNGATSANFRLHHIYCTSYDNAALHSERVFVSRLTFAVTIQTKPL